jgi:hypothetical protein
MKRFIPNLLFIGALAVAANSVATAQTTDSWQEQWYRAKFGRPSPTEQARIDAAKTATSQPTHAAVATKKLPANTFAEEFYQAKHGRPKPREEARIREANLVKGQATTRVASAPVNTWFENWYRDKYGRPSPLAEARLKGQRASATPPQAGSPSAAIKMGN